MQIEDKQKICDLLLSVLQAPHNLRDLVDLEYDGDNDKVIATFASGDIKRANVALDSGTSMIRDIIRQII